MSATAPSYEVLYDFESQIEDAFSSMMAGLTDARCFTQRTDQELVTPRFEFAFTSGAATGHHGRARDGLFYPDAFAGSLRVRHVTARSADITYTMHRQYVATLRRYCYQFETRLTESLLPYLTIDSVLEQSSTQGIDAEHREDITEINFAIAFAIRPGAWPLP